jgi:hypothetical protein
MKTNWKSRKGTGKAKWLASLLLCLACFALCASMISAPTVAAAVPVGLHTLAGGALVDSRNWAGPAAHKDAAGTDRPNSFKATATGSAETTKAFAAYGVNKGYTKLTGAVVLAEACPDTCSLQVKILRGNTVAATSPALTKDSDSYEIDVPLTDADLLTIEVASADESAAAASVIFYDMQLTPVESETPTTTTTTTTTTAATTTLPATDHYTAVSGWAKVYEYVNADGSSKSPKQFVLALDGMPEEEDDYDYRLYQKDSKYYAEYFKENVYAAVKTDGGMNLEDAIWAGADKVFGTEDDKVAEKKQDNGYYYQKADAENEWEFLCWATDLLNPAPGAATTAATTTAITTTTANPNSKTFTLGSTGTVTFRFDKDYADESDVTVKVNGTALTTEQYALSKGSTIVTLTNDYLNTLSVGAYTVTVQFADGAVETAALAVVDEGKPDDTTTTQNPFFTTAGTPVPNLPKTGAELNAALVVSMVLLLLGGCYCGYRYLRKERA